MNLLFRELWPFFRFSATIVTILSLFASLQSPLPSTLRPLPDTVTICPGFHRTKTRWLVLRRGASSLRVICEKDKLDRGQKNGV